MGETEGFLVLVALFGTRGFYFAAVAHDPR